MKKIVLTALAMLALASCAHAASVEPILSQRRLSIAAGANYAAFSKLGASAADIPAFKKEWEAGLYAAYNLTPRLSLVGSSVLGLDNHLVRSSIGLRVRLFRGGEQ